MKWLRRLIWLIVIFFVVMFLFSQTMAWWWGRDQSELSFKNQDYSFTAKRDEASGTWDVKAPNELSLWFAMGYVQAFDREFQTEVVRLAARGEASRLFGEAVLKNDRLMRFSRRASEEEFAKSPDFVKTAAESYVDGREAALADPEKMQPVEYQIMGVARDSLPPWQASDIVAIARFHAWQLSFDANLEQLHLAISKKLGREAADLLLPSEPTNSSALYSQPLLFEGIKRTETLRREKNSAGMPTPQMFSPQASHSSLATPANESYAISAPAIPLGKSIDFDWGTQLALRGASNLWVIADPRVGRALTLCNDTHLRFTWPSSLYPIRYELEGRSSGTGFMLPGVPALVVGSVESRSPENAGSQISWGITLASYGDTQDLVLVDPRETSRFVSKQESYPIRDLLNGQIEVRRIEETWTPFGPRVDTIFADESKDLGRAVALDWLGFSQLQSPFEFFLRRNLEGPANIVDDLHRRLPYPAFNFTWVERKNATSAPKIGHLVTGWLRSRPHREKGGLEALKSEEIASRRRQVQPRDRDFFLRSYESRFPFFLVTANQKIWEGADDLAHSWEPGERAQAIVDAFDANVREPAYSQTDYRSPQLMAFLKSERKRSSANRLCADAPISTSDCIDLLAKLDAWDGNNTVDAWQTTLAALWHAYTKQEIFMGLVPEEQKAELKASVKDWHRRSFSSGVLARIIDNETDRVRWEKASGRKLAEVSLESFRKALSVIVTARGPDTLLWAWGNFHRMDWLHPLVKAPEPWGSVIHDSLLGPRPGVGGALDSPGRFEYSWDEDKPLDFPASHGASLRMCTEFKQDGGLAMRWSAPTGPSGNPFSKYAKVWAFKSFFDSVLSEVPTP